jgi:hypothetical protein
MKKGALLLLSLFLVLAPVSLAKPAQQEAVSAWDAVQYLYQDGAHILRVDLTNPDLRFRTVIANDERGGCERVSSMARRYNALAAINADYFPAGCTWPEGMTYVNGVDRTRSNWPAKEYRSSLAISKSNQASIGIGESDREAFLYNVVGGGPMFIVDGHFEWQVQTIYQGHQRQVMINRERFAFGAIQWENTRKAWNAVGLTQDGRTLILAVSAYKNPAEMAQVLLNQGAWTGMKLDGGGSATMYYNGEVLLGDGRAVANALLIVPKADDVAPEGYIISPTAGSYLNGDNSKVRYLAKAWDDSEGSGVKEVRFYVRYDGSERHLYTATDIPYAFEWSIPSDIADQPLVFTIQAEDKAGNTTPSAGGERVVTLDRTPPANPALALETHGAQSGVWQGAVNDPDFTWGGAMDVSSGVKGYNVYWGLDPEGVSSAWTDVESWNPGPVAPGVYYLRLRTEDRAGNWSPWTTIFTFKYTDKS